MDLESRYSTGGKKSMNLNYHPIETIQTETEKCKKNQRYLEYIIYVTWAQEEESRSEDILKR